MFKCVNIFIIIFLSLHMLITQINFRRVNKEFLDTKKSHIFNIFQLFFNSIFTNILKYFTPKRIYKE